MTGYNETGPSTALVAIYGTANKPHVRRRLGQGIRKREIREWMEMMLRVRRSSAPNEVWSTLESMDEKRLNEIHFRKLKGTSNNDDFVVGSPAAVA